VENVLLNRLGLGISQYKQRIINELRTLLLKGRFEKVKQRLFQLANDKGTEEAFFLLRAAAESDAEGWGAILETLNNVFNVSEISGMDCTPKEFIDEISKRTTNWKEVEDVAREVGLSLIKAQIARGDIYLLHPANMKHPNLLPCAAKILEIREKQNEAIEISRVSSGDINLTGVFGSAQGFELLAEAKIGPILGDEEAKKALTLLKKAKLVKKDVAVESLEKEDLSLPRVRDYSHLFAGFSQKRKSLLNGVVRALDTSPTADIGVKAISGIGHPICKAPLENYVLRGGNSIVEALLGLHFFGLEGIERRILDLLDGNDAKIKAATIGCFEGTQSTRVITKLLSLLKSGDLESEQIGVIGLTAINEPKSRGQLIEFLSSVNPIERGAYVEFIAKTKSIDVVPTLIDLLFFDTFTFIDGKHSQLLRVLANTSGAEREQMNVIMATIRNKVTTALGSMRDVSTSALIGVLEELTNPSPIDPIDQQFLLMAGSPMERVGMWARLRTRKHLRQRELRQRTGLHETPVFETITALGQTGSVDAIPILERLARHSERQIRFQAIEALSEIDEPALGSLLRIETNSDDEMDYFLTTQIGAIVGKSAEDFLVSRLTAKNPSVRTVAYSFLAARRTQEFVKYIEQGVKDKDRQVRLGLANMLILLDDPMYDSVIRILEKDKDKQVRQTAVTRRVSKK
jgi:hypothetical protein